VHAPLRLEDPVGVLAGDRERRGLEAGLLAWGRLDQLLAEAAVARPAQVHAQEHLGPVLGVGAAGPGVDRDDGVAAVVVAPEERGFLEAAELAPQRHDRRLDLVELVVRRDLEQLAEVRDLGRERVVAVEALRQTRVLGREPCRALLIVPEARGAHLLLERGDALAQAIRVKGNHGPSPAAP